MRLEPDNPAGWHLLAQSHRAAGEPRRAVNVLECGSGLSTLLMAAMTSRMGDDHLWLNPLMPLFKWTFEAMYHVDADDLNVAAFASVRS